jgi:hypothetical protein
MRWMCSGEMPWPVSETSTRAPDSSAQVRTQHAAAIHGVARVQEQVQEDLLQLAGVAVHGRQAGGQIQLHSTPTFWI